MWQVLKGKRIFLLDIGIRGSWISAPLTTTSGTIGWRPFKKGPTWWTGCCLANNLWLGSIGIGNSLLFCCWPDEGSFSTNGSFGEGSSIVPNDRTAWAFSSTWRDCWSVRVWCIATSGIIGWRVVGVSWDLVDSGMRSCSGKGELDCCSQSTSWLKVNIVI